LCTFKEFCLHITQIAKWGKKPMFWFFLVWPQMLKNNMQKVQTETEENVIYMFSCHLCVFLVTLWSLYDIMEFLWPKTHKSLECCQPLLLPRLVVMDTPQWWDLCMSSCKQSREYLIQFNCVYQRLSAKEWLYNNGVE
jgi:hypothetical protein